MSGCVHAIWHLITRFVSYEGFTEILSRHFRSKGKMYPELRRSEGFIFIPFERKWRDKISVNPESLTYLVVKCHCATKKYALTLKKNIHNTKK